MIDRRDWTTRPLADHAHGRAEDGAARLPYLWFLADDGEGSALQSWAPDSQTAFVPCFRSQEDAVALAGAAGIAPAHVLGFPLAAVPDLMADLGQPVFLVTGVGDAGRIYGHYLPEPPAARAGAGCAA